MKRPKRKQPAAADTDEQQPPRQRARHSQSKSDKLKAPLLRLPAALFNEHILGALVPLANLKSKALFSLDGLQSRRYPAQFATLRSVCRPWNELLEARIADLQNRCQWIEFKKADHQECDKLLLLEANSEQVEQLEITTGYLSTEGGGPQLVTKHRSLKLAGLIEFPWPKLFAKFQNVVRLDLSVLLGTVVCDVLKAASTSCPQVQALVLPHKSQKPGKRTGALVVAVDTATATSVLVDALRAWHATSGGLRLVHIPCWQADTNGQYNDLLTGIASYCPRLQYLRGWHTGHANPDLHTDEVTKIYNVSSDVWDSFCISCTELHEFSWRMAPLRLPHADAFGSAMKPQLQNLYIADEFRLCEVDDSATQEEDLPNDSHALVRVQLMLRCLPGLRTFDLKLGSARASTVPNNYSRSVNRADSLALEMAMYCREVEQFKYWIPYKDQELMMTSIGLTALASLPAMKELVVSPVQLAEGSSITSIVQAMTRTSRQKRLVYLTSIEPVHTAIHGFLQFLATATTTTTTTTILDLFGDGALRVVVDRDSMQSVTEGIEAKSLLSQATLQALLQSIETKFGGTRVHFELNVLDFPSGSAVSSMTVCVHSTKDTPHHHGTEANKKQANKRQRAIEMDRTTLRLS